MYCQLGRQSWLKINHHRLVELGKAAIGLFTVAIFGSFLASFLDHFWLFGRRMIKMNQKMTTDEQ
jgi:hypothetical protein